jgi:hypothetical protein
MYAYVLEIGRGFFEGVRRLEDRPIAFRDPPPLAIRKSSYASTIFVAGALRIGTSAWPFSITLLTL